jgi:hypothetical protein
MIDWAAQRCERLVVYVNSSNGARCGAGRAASSWLAELHPHVTVIEVRHSLGTDFDDEELWAKWMELFTERWPHDDGPARRVLLRRVRRRAGVRFDAQHVVVDADRTTVPISATQIRESPGDHLHHLAPPVRAWVESNWL